MICAIFEKSVGLKISPKDGVLQMAGGLKVNDAALDLAVICARLSSNVDLKINERVCVTGEVGLSGENRQVTRRESRITEAEKLGFETIIIPKYNLKGINTQKLAINIIEVSKVEDASKYLFG